MKASRTPEPVQDLTGIFCPEEECGRKWRHGKYSLRRYNRHWDRRHRTRSDTAGLMNLFAPGPRGGRHEHDG